MHWVQETRPLKPLIDCVEERQASVVDRTGQDRKASRRDTKQEATGVSRPLTCTLRHLQTPESQALWYRPCHPSRLPLARRFRDSSPTVSINEESYCACDHHRQHQSALFDRANKQKKKTKKKTHHERNRGCTSPGCVGAILVQSHCEGSTFFDRHTCTATALPRFHVRKQDFVARGRQS